MNWDDYCKLLTELGVSSIHVKRLSPNDNSRNQVYLGRSKGIIPLIPKSEFEVVQEGGKNPRGLPMYLGFGTMSMKRKPLKRQIRN